MFWLNKRKGKESEEETCTLSEKLWQSFASKKRRQHERALRAEGQGCREVPSVPAAGHKPLQSWVTVSCEGSRDLIPQRHSACKAEKGPTAFMGWNTQVYQRGLLLSSSIGIHCLIQWSKTEKGSSCFTHLCVLLQVSWKALPLSS